mmetsp:Transcript_38804/g.110715  ORF Transcript_38804/g.110715 Transcript_38804/m.110715 type:complete len:263 (+) Transcript_38804:392-1180(+)
MGLHHNPGGVQDVESPEYLYGCLLHEQGDILFLWLIKLGYAWHAPHAKATALEVADGDAPHHPLPKAAEAFCLNAAEDGEAPHERHPVLPLHVLQDTFPVNICKCNILHDVALGGRLWSCENHVAVVLHFNMMRQHGQAAILRTRLIQFPDNMGVQSIDVVPLGAAEKPLEPLDGLREAAVVATEHPRYGNVAKKAGVQEALRLSRCKGVLEPALEFGDAVLLLLRGQRVQLVWNDAVAALAPSSQTHPRLVQRLQLISATP